MANEEKEAFLKKVRSCSVAFGEALAKESWQEAFDLANDLNTLLKSEEIDDFTGKELKEVNIDEMRSELKKYWYFNGEMRKCQGALRNKGKKFVDFAN